MKLSSRIEEEDISEVSHNDNEIISRHTKSPEYKIDKGRESVFSKLNYFKKGEEYRAISLTKFLVWEALGVVIFFVEKSNTDLKLEKHASTNEHVIIRGENDSDQITANTSNIPYDILQKFEGMSREVIF